MNSEVSLDSMTVPVSDTEAFYKTLLENAFDGIGIIDFDGSIKYHSDPIKNILGYDGEFKRIANIFKLIHPDDSESFRIGLNELKNNPDVSHGALTARFKHHDGSWRYIATRLNNLSQNPTIKGIVISYRDITQKQLLRESIEESEKRYKSLIENSFDGITVINFDGIVKYHSPSMLRILGYRPSSGVGKSIFELMHPDSIPVVRQSLKQMKKQEGKLFTGSVKFKRKDETFITLEARAVNLLDQPGIEGVLINYRDITEREKLETALRESESRYKSLASVSPVGIFTTDTQGNCTYVNEKWCQLSELSYDESMGKGWSKYIHPDDIAKVWENCSEATAKKQSYRIEYRLTMPDGKITWVYCQAVPDIDECGNVIGYIGSVTDISERMQMEKALQESGELYRKMVENAPEAIFIVDVEKCKFVDFNENAEKLFGYTREQMLGMNAINVCPLVQPDGRNSQELANEKIKEALSGGKPVYELQYKDSYGRLFIAEERLVRFPPYDRKLVLGTAIDISERKKMKQDLRDSEERYRNMVENAQETIFIIDAETDKIVDFNENAVRLFGYSRSELLTKRISALSPPFQPDGKISIDKSMEIAREALKKGKVFFEWTHQKANRNTFPSEVHLSRFPPFDRKLLRGTVIDITAKKELEKKLREQELEYRHLASVSPVGIFRTNAKGKTTYVNEKWCEITGISASKAIGNGWMKTVHPEDREWTLADWKESVKRRKISRAEFRFVTPDGKINWVLGEAVPDYDNQGVFLGFAGSITEITERVKAEQALAKSQQRNAVLLNAIPDMIFRLSKNGTFLDCKVASNFNPIVPPEFFLGKKVREVLPAHVADLSMRNIRQALKTNKIQTYSYSLPDVSDNSKLNYFEARIVVDESNEVLALIRDITHQKEAELSLIASEEKWRSLVKSAPQYIVTIDKNDRITFINYLSTLKPHQIIGKSVYNLLQTSSIKRNEIKKLLNLARKGKSNGLEFSLRNKGQDLMWLNVKAAPVKSNAKVPELIVMALDITERKKAEEELTQSNEKLKALYQRMETIREEEKKNIALEIHDELGQHLTAMKLGMFWLQQYIDQQKNNGLDILQMEDKVKSLIDLSSQTIASARKLAHQLRPVVLDNLGLIPAIEWQIKMANESGKVQCEFRHTAGKIKFLDAFSVALYRIIQESLTNILRHSKATTASFDLNIQNKNLILVIHDNGIGIKASDIKHPSKIGLFGMRERIQSWKGKFELSGKPGKGTVLRITFPLKEILKNK